MYPDAISFEQLDPPGPLIAQEVINGVRYYYFAGKDENGNEQIYYETDSGFRTKQELEGKRKKKKSR